MNGKHMNKNSVEKYMRLIQAMNFGVRERKKKQQIEDSIRCIQCVNVIGSVF